jgi:uncharacterized protein YqjF (DUF2071 family)
MGWALMQGDVSWAAMVTFDIAPHLLASEVPAGTELDLFEGRALLSLVAFHFADNRVLGVPLPFAREYDQVNLRFYVRRRQEGGAWRHGVVFLRELAPALPVVAGARFVYGERYDCVPVTSRVRAPDAAAARTGRALYRWRDKHAVHRLAVDFHGPAVMPAPGSIEQFLTERHFGYVSAERATREYRVDHPPWRVWPATNAHLSPGVHAAFGRRFERALDRAPLSAFVAEGSRMYLHRPHPVAGTAGAYAAADAARYAPP